MLLHCLVCWLFTSSLDAPLHGGAYVEHLLLLFGHELAGLRDEVTVLLVLLCTNLLYHLTLLGRIYKQLIGLLQVLQLPHPVNVGGTPIQLMVLLVGELLLSHVFRLVEGLFTIELDLLDVRILGRHTWCTFRRLLLVLLFCQVLRKLVLVAILLLLERGRVPYRQHLDELALVCLIVQGGLPVEPLLI